MAVARALPGTEILAVDAMQVYRGMDIGTAKPTPADRAAVVHHGLDLVAPTERFTLAEYQRAATAALDDARARGADVLLVAGTGLYLTAVIDGLTLPGEWPELRADLEQRPAGELYARLTALDPSAAARIEPGNTRRLARALEVTLGSGRPFSSFGPGMAAFAPTDVAQIGVRWPRDVLRRRIAARVDAMLAAGLVDEVAALVRAEGLSPTARQALGYKEIIDHLEGRATLLEAAAAITLRTSQFAVRQDRWFRRDPRIRWVDVTADPVAEVAPVVLEHLA
jgi:tRNA dimethylallyltransferase